VKLNDYQSLAGLLTVVLILLIGWTTPVFAILPETVQSVAIYPRSVPEDQGRLPSDFSGPMCPMTQSAGLRYKGELFDASANQSYMRNRQYEPVYGRFAQVDPARAGLNWYDFCGGDPVNRKDTTGLDWQWNDEQSAWEWKANATDPNKGELQDIPIPDWAVPGYNWTPGLPKVISTEHALTTRWTDLAFTNVDDPTLKAFSQLIGSGYAGTAVQEGDLSDEGFNKLYAFFKKQNITDAKAGIQAYTAWADGEETRINAEVEAARRQGATVDTEETNRRLTAIGKGALEMVPVVAAMDALDKANRGDYKGAGKDVASIIPWGKVAIGGVAVVGKIVHYAVGGGMRVAAINTLRKLGLEGVNLAGSSFNTGRKQLEAAGFKLVETTDTGRKVFVNSKTGARVYYDSGDALVGNQKPHWHIQDGGGVDLDRMGRPVDSSENAAHIPAQ